MRARSGLGRVHADGQSIDIAGKPIESQPGGDPMYGTVARLRIPANHREALTELGHQIEIERPPGLIATYVYQTDADPDEYYLTVLFESRAAYLANAESPEQDRRYRRLRELLAADPEWHDGEVVFQSPPRPSGMSVAP
jgi:heme-degrading monooxygenase HmoA